MKLIAPKGEAQSLSPSLKVLSITNKSFSFVWCLGYRWAHPPYSRVQFQGHATEPTEDREPPLCGV